MRSQFAIVGGLPAVRYRESIEFVLLFCCAVGLDALARRRTTSEPFAHV